MTRNSQLWQNGLSLRLLVKETVDNIAIPLDIFGFAVLRIFCIFFNILGFGVFVNQPTVPSE